MTAPTRTILVTAASGNIGTELVPLLAKEPNTKLVLPTRSAANLQSSVPASTSPTVAIEQGDLGNPIWFESLLTRHAVDTVFLCLQGGHGVEIDTTLNLLDAMRRAGTVKQLVYVSVCGDFVSPAGIEDLMRLCGAGHMLVKIPIELKLKHGGFPWATTVLGPSLFFTNDKRSLPSMLERGVFDEPVGPASRVHPRDIALVARNIIFSSPQGKYAGQKIQLGSLHQFSGEEVAALWSGALGKEVRVMGGDAQTLGSYEAERAGSWGEGFARDMRLMHECFWGMGFGMSGGEYAGQVEVLGKEAEDYGKWVRGVGGEMVRKKGLK